MTSPEKGQQRFDNHVDKLLNYIRYWQAYGESIKTSIRTKTRLAQIVQEGRFRGGCAPYGYKLVKNGRTGKKNRELYDIAVEPTEAVTVQKIFELSDRYGYGGRKISSSLAEGGIVNMRAGEPFHYSSIQNILRNIMYVGILRSGETQWHEGPNSMPETLQGLVRFLLSAAAWPMSFTYNDTVFRWIVSGNDAA